MAPLWRKKPGYLISEPFSPTKRIAVFSASCSPCHLTKMACFVTRSSYNLETVPVVHDVSQIGRDPALPRCWSIVRYPDSPRSTIPTPNSPGASMVRRYSAPSVAPFSRSSSVRSLQQTDAHFFRRNQCSSHGRTTYNFPLCSGEQFLGKDQLSREASISLCSSARFFPVWDG